MKRREFITLLGGAAAAWPLAARGQQGDRVRLDDMAAELVQMNVDVIVTPSAGLASLVRKATLTIPIVVAAAGELEGTGLIASLRRPSGNVTGIQILSPELMGKRIELLKEFVPSLRQLGIVVPDTPAATITSRYLEQIAEAARALQIQIHSVRVRTSDQLDAAITTIAGRAQAALVIANPLAAANAKAIAAYAAQNRIPTMYESRFYTLAGGLLSYGSDIVKLHRQAATYVDKVLRGANAGDLPIQQPTKFDLVINLKTAKVLGLAVPDKLLALADEVIE